MLWFMADLKADSNRRFLASLGRSLVAHFCSWEPDCFELLAMVAEDIDYLVLLVLDDVYSPMNFRQMMEWRIFQAFLYSSQD